MRLRLLYILLAAITVVACADSPGGAPRAQEPATPVGGKADSFEDNDEVELLFETALEDFLDHPDTSRFEASGVVIHDERILIAFDNLRTFASVDLDLADLRWFGDEDGYGVEDDDAVEDPDDLVGFEGITVDADGVVTLAVETIENRDGEYHAGLVTWDLAADEGTEAFRWIDHEFPDANAGVEGLTHLRVDGEHFLAALCEAGKCDDRNRGRMLLLDDRGQLDHLNLPSGLDFDDFSGIASRGDRLAVTSQESSTVWIGRLVLDEDGAPELQTEDVLAFPRQRDGDVHFCNIEGVDWLTDDLLLTVSDVSKSDQPSRCDDHSESIQLFALPPQ